MPRILVADDHDLIRAGIRLLLETLPDVHIVAEAGNGRDAVELTRLHKPDLALLDIAMPDMNGLEAAARIVKQFPRTRVAMMSCHANEEYVLQAMRSGARGYLVKNAQPSELGVAIGALMAGQTYLSPAVSRQVIDDYVGRLGSDTPSLDHLTLRQQEILKLVTRGHSSKSVAQVLNLSVKTIETHRTRLMERLDIHHVPGLVRYAVRVGMITAED